MGHGASAVSSFAMELRPFPVRLARRDSAGLGGWLGGVMGSSTPCGAFTGRWGARAVLPPLPRTVRRPGRALRASRARFGARFGRGASLRRARIGSGRAGIGLSGAAPGAVSSSHWTRSPVPWRARSGRSGPRAGLARGGPLLEFIAVRHLVVLATIAAAGLVYAAARSYGHGEAARDLAAVLPGVRLVLAEGREPSASLVDPLVAPRLRPPPGAGVYVLGAGVFGDPVELRLHPGRANVGSVIGLGSTRGVLAVIGSEDRPANRVAESCVRLVLGAAVSGHVHGLQIRPLAGALGVGYAGARAAQVQAPAVFAAVPAPGAAATFARAAGHQGAGAAVRGLSVAAVERVARGWCAPGEPRAIVLAVG